MIDTKTAMKQDKGALVAELKQAGAVFTQGNAFKCCFHDDNRPSAGIFESDTGWRYKCQGCGESGDVWDVIAHNEGKSRANC